MIANTYEGEGGTVMEGVKQAEVIGEGSKDDQGIEGVEHTEVIDEESRAEGDTGME